MNEERGLLRAVSWRDLCPWLIIFRVYRLAVSFPVLLLATLAVLLTPLGWRLGERLFLREEGSVIETLYQFRDEPGNLHRWPGEREDAPAAGEFRRLDLARGVYTRATNEVASVFHGLIEPFRQLFDYRWTLAEFAFFFWGGLWTLVVWAFFGGAITRWAIVPLAAERRVGLRSAVGHAARKFPTYFLAPLFPFLGVFIAAAVLALFGLILRLGEVGVLVAGVLWLVVLIGGFAMAYLLVGLLFGWPLMWVAASAERDADFFESVSRAYSYTRQAPLRYLFYALVAVLFGGLCWLLVQLFAEAVIYLGEWGVSWGAGRDRLLALREAALLVDANDSAAVPPMLRVGLGLMAAWTALVRTIATAFVFGFFWCAYCALYLLLRHDVDHREMDEVWLAAERPSPAPSRPVVSQPEAAEDPVQSSAGP